MKLSFTMLLIVIFAGFALGQSIKTDEAKRLEIVENLIADAETTLEESNKALEKLRGTYSSEYPKVKEYETKIKGLKENLGRLYEERKKLLTKQMIRNLPNNQIELLKIIIQQNERIIELLESKQKT